MIYQELDKLLPISTVGEYLKRWEFTSKKPIKRAYEQQRINKLKQWLEVEYPKIKKQAKKDNADIWWCDETHCQRLPTNLKGYAKKGTKPVLSHPAKKFLVQTKWLRSNDSLWEDKYD